MNSEIGLCFSRRSILRAAALMPFVAVPATGSPLQSRIMVQGRPQDTGSLYKLRNIMPALDALGGVRKMRCRSPFRNTPGWRTYAGLANAGVKFCFTLPIKEPLSLIADLVAFERRHPDAIFAIEFPNEPDLNPVTYKGVKDVRLGARTGNAPALMAFCRDVKTLLSQTEELKEIPIVAFNDWMHREQSTLVNFANSHIYPRLGANAKAWLPGWRELLSESGHTQGFITEWGRTTGGGRANNVAPPVTLDQQAELLASDIEAILTEESVAILSLYELMSWPGSGEQENFGLFNVDLSPRPAVEAIRSLIG